MFDKRKLNFWRLAVIFAGFIAISLFFLWTSPNRSKASMMNVSMGTMSKNMELKSVTIYDLLSKPEMSEQSSDTAGHHSEEPSTIKTMGILTTLTIFGLLPFIIGGSIILAIVWIK